LVEDPTSGNRAIDELLAKAIRQRPGVERERWIVRACRGDAALEFELRCLIAAYEEAGTFLEKPLVDPPPEWPATDRI